MEKLRFKTGLKCNGCVNAIRPGMDNIHGIASWNVDLTVDPKILEVETTPDKSSEIMEVVKKTGYFIEAV